MASKRLGLFLMGVAWPALSLAAQQAASPAPLSPVQREGRRVFQQKCAVCHVPASSLAKPYAPKLSQGSIADHQDQARAVIVNGRGEWMPGFQYTLQPAQIDDVMEYLKTLDEPARTVASPRPDR